MGETVPLLGEDPKEIHQYYGESVEPRRWWILICFILYSAISNLVSLSFSSTGGPSMQYLNIGESQLLLFSELNMLAVFVFSYFGAWYAHKKFKETLLLCILVTTLGGWVRYAAGSDFTWVLVGQVLVSSGSAPVYGIAILIPDRWFSAKERFVITNISVFSNNFGWAISYIIPPLVVGDDASKLPMYVLFQAIFMSIPFIMGMLCVTERPKVPPSYSAMIKLIDPSGFWEEMKVLFGKPKFVPVAITFGVVLGSSYSIAAVSGIVTRKFAFSNLDQSILGSCYIGIGITAGLLGTLWVEKKKSVTQYDLVIKILLTISFITLIATEILINVFEKSNVVLIIVCHGIVGIGLIGIAPFLFDSVAESTFPVQEAVSGNALYVIQCIAAIVMNRVSLHPWIGTNGFGLLAVCVFPCWVYIMFYFKTNFLRQKADAEKREIDDNAIETVALLGQKGGDKSPLTASAYKNFVNTLEDID